MPVIEVLRRIVTHPVFVAAAVAAVRELTKLLMDKNRR